MRETVDGEGTTTETSEVLPGTGKRPDTTGFCRRIKTETKVNNFDIRGQLNHTHSACCNILSHVLNTVSFIFKPTQDQNSYKRSCYLYISF